ncbi:MAG: B12-binding domain-containing radical SAM protein [Spirochaetes bacterium]|nr:B12-binding domain-containing radical SAM protein [Spirochaetota bacterium]
MNVLLINPPYPFEESPTPPFGLMSLAAYIREHGHTVTIDDYIVFPYSKKRVEEISRKVKPSVIGATAVTMNVNRAIAILKDYKDINPDAITVMGGPHVSFDAENILSSHPHIDFIVRGEGEITFTELLNSFEHTNDPARILGISYRTNGKICHNDPRPFIDDINVLPFPARDLVALNRYKALGFPINMVTARGCPHKCIFCVGSRMVGRKVRYFHIDRVVEEFEMLSKLGFSQINIVDDLFTSNKNRCMAICEEIIRRKINHPWTAFARVDTVSKELLKLMKMAGCTMLCFGIESGNQEILNTVKKKITLDRCKEAIALCEEVGISPMASYILGLPGESPETIAQTMEFAKSLTPNYGYHILAPFPGTEVREKKEEYGITILTDDWDKYDANRSVSHTGLVSPEYIDEIVESFNSGIKRYIENAIKRKQAGEIISEKDERLIHKISSFFVVKDIMMMELVESYMGKNGKTTLKEIIHDFSYFVAQNTGHQQELIENVLNELISSNTLTLTDVDGTAKFCWQ